MLFSFIPRKVVYVKISATQNDADIFHAGIPFSPFCPTSPPLQLLPPPLQSRSVRIRDKKEEIWPSPMTKAPTPTEMSKGQSDNTNNATKKFD